MRRRLPEVTFDRDTDPANAGFQWAYRGRHLLLPAPHFVGDVL